MEEDLYEELTNSILFYYETEKEEEVGRFISVKDNHVEK